MTDRIRAIATSYRGRLALGYAVVVALLAGAWAWSLFGPVTQVVVEQQRSHLEAIARASALALSGEHSAPSQEVRRLVARTDLRITVVAADGTVLADSTEDPAAMGAQSQLPEVRAALAGRVGSDTRTAGGGVPQLYVAAPATVSGGRGAVRVSEPLARMESLASRARDTGLLLLAAAIVAAVLVGLRMARAASEPVLNLKRSAERMADGDLRAAVPAVAGELGGLADALVTLRDRMRTTIGELESGQATLRTVLDGLGDAVFLVDGDTIEVANRAASMMFRPPASGWRGAALHEAGLPASLAADIQARLECGETCSGEVGPDPEQRWLKVTAVPLNATDRATRTLVIVADNTSERRLDRVRRDFVANASHELKTPTAAIQLLADAAGTAAGDGDTEAALTFVSQIKAEADRLRRLVLDLLDLSRLDAAPVAGSITDVRAAASNALAGHAPAATAAGLSLAFDDSAVAGQDVYAAADPTDLAVALDNLLANALAYTDEGGVRVALGADEETVSVSVADTGVGIAPEHLSRVFERFYRVDPARARASGGTGLGLSLVRNAAERSGGSVEIESQVGMGTTITLRLPRAR